MTTPSNSADHAQALAEDLLRLSKKLATSSDAQQQQSEIVAKAQQLILAVQSPLDHAQSLLTSVVKSGVIRTLVSLGILKAIPATGSIGLQELERATGSQAALIERLLRVVLGEDFVRLNKDQTYSHGPISRQYADGLPAVLFPAIIDETSTVLSLPAYFKARGAREPDGELATTHNPVTWCAGQEGKTFFEIAEQDPERVAQLQAVMNAAALWRPYTGFYDYGALATADTSRAELVDVGGGDGYTMAQILTAHPQLKPSSCVVQDRARTVELAAQKGHLPGGVRCEAHDFFTPQPVKHARAYQLRACLHDWSDSQSIKILKQIVPAMAPDSKLLIAENVIPDSGAQGMTAVMDVMMLCIGGKERTKANFEDILNAAGLKLNGVFTARGMDFGVVEASLIK